MPAAREAQGIDAEQNRIMDRYRDLSPSERERRREKVRDRLKYAFPEKYVLEKPVDR